MTRASLAEQLAVHQSRPPVKPARTPVPANDNRKPPQPRYRGTLPALRWLWDNRPELAAAFANALPRPAANWFVEVEPTRQEIRPTIGELLAASHDEDSVAHPQLATNDGVTLGRLRFRKGALIEWGVTKKGKKLKPTDRPRISGDAASTSRNPAFYLATKATTPSPMEAHHYHRPFIWGAVLPPMYDPLPGVEAARRELEALGVDGSVAAERIDNVTMCPTVPAEGAGFLGGVSNPSGNSSSGAVMWETPEPIVSSAMVVIEEVAARGTLKSIGMRLGYLGEAADKAGKAALVEVAQILHAMSEKRAA